MDVSHLSAKRLRRRSSSGRQSPYNVSSPTSLPALDLHRRTRLLRDATVMLQREVVERVTAAPGTR
jgi:16S rRNA A1518/A1519 N6-dimethyltransferase RsmA/KsgA/DIM1 with predicted DNA glycosylase/AP lyase activity